MDACIRKTDSLCCTAETQHWKSTIKVNVLVAQSCRLFATPSTIAGLPGGSEVKASACNAGDQGSIPGLGRSPGEGNGNPLQYSCLENPTDRGAWRATVHRVAKSWTRLSDLCIIMVTIN